MSDSLPLTEVGDLAWGLTPEGAIVHAPGRVAVVADVHLGYEWARGAGGDMLPPHSLAETTAKLARLLSRVALARLVVAGDLVESSSPCRRTAADVARLRAWLADRGIELVTLPGNHDPIRHSAPATLAVAGWTIGHGHRPIPGPRRICGHWHPVLRLGGLAAPCFLISPTTVVLPAFSPNAAGWNVAAGPLPEGLRLGEESTRCIASDGGGLLDFGPLAALRAHLRGGRPG